MTDSTKEPDIYKQVREDREAGRLTVRRAIMHLCLDCSSYSKAEVRNCQIKDCPLWDFRLGKNPYRAKRVMTPEQREAARVRLANARKDRP